jgi:hypothetical protein
MVSSPSGRVATVVEVVDGCEEELAAVDEVVVEVDVCFDDVVEVVVEVVVVELLLEELLLEELLVLLA